MALPKTVEVVGRYQMRYRLIYGFLGLGGSVLFFAHDSFVLAGVYLGFAALYISFGLLTRQRLKLGLYGESEFEQKEVARYWCKKAGLRV